MSEDPIGLDGGINPFPYASNDPVNGSDPSGLVERCFDSGFFLFKNGVEVDRVVLSSTCFDDGTGGPNAGSPDIPPGILAGLAGGAGPCGRLPASMKKDCERRMARFFEQGGAGELPACFAAKLDLTGRLAVDLALGFTFASGVGLAGRGLLLVGRGLAIRSSLILTATSVSPQTSGAIELGLGGAFVFGGATAVAGEAAAIPEGISVLPRNTFDFLRSGGLSACRGS